jgi:hypothetical protein
MISIGYSNVSFLNFCTNFRLEIVLRQVSRHCIHNLTSAFADVSHKKEHVAGVMVVFAVAEGLEKFSRLLMRCGR